MGSGSSSVKKSSTDAVVSVAQEEVNDDLKAVKLIKEQTTKLERIRDDRNKLDGYIKSVHDRLKEREEGNDDISNAHGERVKLVTDTVDKLVEDLIDYVDKINVTFDDMQGSLELFHDAVVKAFEKSQSDVKKQNVNGSIDDIVRSLNNKIKKVKERTTVTKHQNVTKDILKATETELEEYRKMKEDVDQQNKVLQDKRKELTDELKNRGVTRTVIEEILQWKEDVIKLERQYGHILINNDQVSEETKAQLKDMKEKNEALKSELDSLHRQCLECDKNAQDANGSVQKVEEKILEERLNHEVEINALRALLEQRDRQIKKLGGQTTDSPLSQSPEVEKEVETYSKRISQYKVKTDENDDENNLKTTETKSVTSNKGKFIGEIGVEDVNGYEEANSEHESQDTILTSRQVAIVQVPEDIIENETRSENPVRGATSAKYVSTAVQVSEEELLDADIMKLGEKEQTSSDLGLSVKSEYVENNQDLMDNDGSYDDTDDSDKNNKAVQNKTNNIFDGLNNDTNKIKQIGKNQDEKSTKQKNNEAIRQDSINDLQSGVVSDNQAKSDNVNITNTRGLIGMANNHIDEKQTASTDEAFQESFADMIQIVSKDECITALETTEEDVHIYEGTTKEIVYKRNDGGIDWDVAYHKGIGAVIRTTHEQFGIDTIRVDVIDEVESSMLPDLVLGERPISFHLHIRQKDGVNLDLEENDVKLFVPHRPLKEYEDVTLIYSLNGGDWEDCDMVDEYPASVESEVDIVGTVLPDIRDVKLVVIAREKMIDLMAGEGDISYVSSFDESIRVNISKDTFRSHTVAKLLVHHSHILGLQSAVNTHAECRNISSCTAFISIVCASVTRSNILVDMDLSHLGGVTGDEECPYTMFCMTESGWKLADCTWDLTNRRLTINLMPGSRSYRVIGIEVPMSIHMEERLSAVKTIHEHTSHYQVCVFVRQRLDDPQQAVVMCLRSHLAKQAISELGEKGFSMGHLMSDSFCIMDGDVLSIAVTGDITARPVNSEKMTMTFYPQRELSTRLLLLHPVDADDQDMLSSGDISVIKHETNDNIDVLSGAISLS